MNAIERLVFLVTDLDEKVSRMDTKDDYSAGKAQAYAYISDVLESLPPELEAMARDAGRYRWLRAKRSVDELEVVMHDEGVYLDAAIDAAIAAEQAAMQPQPPQGGER